MVVFWPTSMSAPWYESNVFWGPASLAIGIIVSVLPMVKQDLRWLLFVAWPLFTISSWYLLRSVHPPYAAALFIASASLAIAGGLVWLDAKLHPVAKAVVAPVPLPRGPRFTESVEKIATSVGSVTWHKAAPELTETNGGAPFVMPGNIPARVYRDQGQTLVDVSIYSGDGVAPLEIKRNVFTDRTPEGWDINYSDSAFEVVNDRGEPRFQLIYKSDSKVQVYGAFPFHGGVMFADDSKRTVINPGPNYRFKLNPIFKYPAWRNRGVYAEAPIAEAPDKDTELTGAVLEVEFHPDTGDAKNAAVTLQVRLANKGKPSTVSEYSLDVINPGGTRRFTHVEILRDAQRFTFQGRAVGIVDDLLDKTFVTDVTKSAPVVGLIRFVVENASRAEIARKKTRLVLSFVDSVGRRYEIVHVVRPRDLKVFAQQAR